MTPHNAKEVELAVSFHSLFIKRMFYFDDSIQNWKSDFCKLKVKKQLPHKSHSISFPTFGRCESLKQFPIAFASCLNSGDLNSLSRLIHTRTSKHCQIVVLGQVMDREDVLDYYSLSNELYPDGVIYMHQTASVGNRISSQMYFKYTTNKGIEGSVQSENKAAMKKRPVLHTDPHRLNEFIASQPVEDRMALLTSVYTAQELVVSGKGSMTFTYDDKTKKITSLEVKCDCADFTPVDISKLKL